MPKKGVVIALGATGDCDDGRCHNPSVLLKDGYYWMYYAGYNGAKYRICLAISKDGINFTKKGVVIPLGATGDCDDNNIQKGSSFFKDGYFWLFYSGYDGTNYRICLAISKDGINFTKKGVVIPLGATGDCDDVHTQEGSVTFKDGFFWLYYTGHDGTNYRVCLALSKDGINFTKKGVVIPLGATGNSDVSLTLSPSVFFKDGYFWLFYSGYDNAKYRVCLALSKDGINFTKKGVVIPLGTSPEIDYTRSYGPSVTFKDGHFWLYYTGIDAANYRICLAISKDGINFS